MVPIRPLAQSSSLRADRLEGKQFHLYEFWQPLEQRFSNWGTQALGGTSNLVREHRQIYEGQFLKP